MDSVVNFITDPIVQIVLVLLLPVLLLLLAARIVYLTLRQARIREQRFLRGYTKCDLCGHKNSYHAESCARCGKPLLRARGDPQDAWHARDPWSRARHR